MTTTERYDLIVNAAKAYDSEEIDLSELSSIAADAEVKQEDIPKLIGTVVYIKQRLIFKRSRAKAFEVAFPERCIFQGRNSNNEFETDLQIGDKLSSSSINIKAKRLEASPMYKKVFTILQTSLYVAYATDRLRVLDEALAMSLDPHVSDRDRHNYMKLFLDETRKPAEAAKMELNMHVVSNHINVVDIEQKMNDMAARLQGLPASQLVEVLDSGRAEN